MSSVSSDPSGALPQRSVTSVRKVRLCLGCEVSIPQARLNAMPNARYCVPCQEQKDVEGSHPIREDETGPEGDEDNQAAYAELARENDRTGRGFRETWSDSYDLTPSPENTSVQAMNLGSAASLQEAVLLRENICYTQHRGSRHPLKSAA